MNIRNIAIIAHVDHGKTTLVDSILKQSNIFRSNQKEMQEELLMDSNDLEREKGITILSKNTSIEYKESKINIIDTPGHADFGGEVERVLNMASGALLLVDAAEGPLPQTRFVLQKALAAKLKIIVFINKIDKKDARPIEVRGEVENLFLDVAEDDSALDFTTMYGVGRDGTAYAELPDVYKPSESDNLQPLFDAIIEHVPNSNLDEDKPFQMLISTLDYDSYVGRLSVGKVSRGTLKKGQRVALVQDGKKIGTYTATKLYVSRGLGRNEVDEIVSGDIAALAGIPELSIGQTVTDPEHPDALPTISVSEPTIRIGIGPNMSPFAGREGEFVTSRQIKARLDKELETNLGLRVDEAEEGHRYTVSGRGELHLSVLIETMRREGFELEVSKPKINFKEVDGQKCEPYEEVTIDVHKDYVGFVSDELGKRKAVLKSMHSISESTMRFIYKISSRNLIGIRSVLLTGTSGTGIMSTYLLGYEPLGSGITASRNGALVSSETGETMTHGLLNAQQRGTLFFGPGQKVYEGMIVGMASGDRDLEINVCREKKLTNNRSSGEGVKAGLEPATQMSLEQYLDFIDDDELLEVTPSHIRARKKLLTQSARRVEERKKKIT